MRRRHFLLLSGTLATAALAAAGWRLVDRPKSWYVVSVVRARLPYLSISDDVVGMFATDFVEADATMSDTRALLIAYVGTAGSHWAGAIIGEGFRRQVDSFEERIASTFLLSTDFFQSGRGTERQLQYLGLADPYLNSCGNPLVVLA